MLHLARVSHLSPSDIPILPLHVCTASCGLAVIISKEVHKNPPKGHDRQGRNKLFMCSWTNNSSKKIYWPANYHTVKKPKNKHPQCVKVLKVRPLCTVTMLWILWAEWGGEQTDTFQTILYGLQTIGLWIGSNRVFDTNGCRCRFCLVWIYVVCLVLKGLCLLFFHCGISPGVLFIRGLCLCLDDICVLCCSMIMGLTCHDVWFVVNMSI